MDRVVRFGKSTEYQQREQQERESQQANGGGFHIFSDPSRSSTNNSVGTLATNALPTLAALIKTSRFINLGTRKTCMRTRIKPRKNVDHLQLKCMKIRIFSDGRD